MDGSTANGVLTYGGTDNIDVESNLTFDGSTLTVNGDIRINDSAAGGLEVGTSQDLQIYHNGTNSFGADNYTGHLIFQQRADDQDIIFRNDDGSGGVTDYITLDGGLGYTTSQKDFRLLADNINLSVGASTDLYFYHDGTDSWMRNKTGNLYIRSEQDDKDIILQSDDGSGGVTAYLTLDGSAGYTVASKQIRSNDNVALTAGTDGDLNLLHDGTDSYVENWTGDLYIRNNNNDKDIALQSDDGSGGVTNYILLDGSNNSIYAYKPLFVGSSAQIQLDDVNSRLLLKDDISLKLGTGGDFNAFHNGTNTFLRENTNDLYIDQLADDKDIILRSDDGSGGVTAYLTLDGSVVRTVFDKPAQFNDDIYFPDSAVAYFGTNNDLRLFHNGSHSFIQQYGTGDLYIDNTIDDKSIFFRTDDGSGGVTTYLAIRGDEGQMRANKQLRMQDNVQLQVGSSGDAQFFHNTADTYLQNSTGHLYIQNTADDRDIIVSSDDGSGGIRPYITLDGGTGDLLLTPPTRTEI